MFAALVCLIGTPCDPRRAATRAVRGSHRLDAFRILGLITWIILTLFLLRGARIALGDAPYPTAWTPISTAVSHLFTPMSQDWQSFFAWFFLWAHLALVLGFLVYLPYSKHLHIITSGINVWFASTRPHGALEPLRIDMERLESGEQSLGAQTLSDLTRKELLDLYACTECGRCQSVCPAWNTGKPLSPKLLIMDLRDHLLDDGPNVLQVLARARLPTRWRWCRGSSTTTSCGRARRAARASRSAPWTSSTWTRSSISAGRW